MNLPWISLRQMRRTARCDPGMPSLVPVETPSTGDEPSTLFSREIDLYPLRSSTTGATIVRRASARSGRWLGPLPMDPHRKLQNTVDSLQWVSHAHSPSYDAVLRVL